MTRRYKGFISYSWTDKKWASWVHRALELYVPPRDLVGTQTPIGPVPPRLHPIFRDRDDSAAGHGVTAAIESALGDSEFLIVICSPRAAQSKWVNREVAWFKRHRDPKRILALIIEGEPAECFPPALIHRVDENLVPTSELEDAPLAADARVGGDGRRDARLKLAAAMLGVGLDDLVRRDERRRARRRRLVTAAALMLAVVMTGLALFALHQRDAAILARNVALAAEKEAKFQADEAQALVEFMLTDFRQELDSLGRLDVLERTGRRLLESFAKQDMEKLDAHALGRRARVQLLLGEVDNTRGNLDAALARYQEAEATTAELLRRNPGSAQQVFDHAQAVFWVGYIGWQRGDDRSAETQFLTYYKLAQQLVAMEPGKHEWRMEVGYALSNLGTLAMDKGETAKAERYFALALEHDLKLLEAAPDDRQRQIGLAGTYSWLASAKARAGKFAEAGEVLLRESAVLDRVLSADKLNSDARQSLFVNARFRGRIALSSGHVDNALALLVGAVEGQRALLESEPDNVQFRQFYNLSLIELGETYLAAGKLSAASSTAAVATSSAAALNAKDGSVQNWSITSGLTQRLAASVALAKGDFKGALAYVEQMQQSQSAETSVPNASYERLSKVGTVVALKATILSRAGHAAASREAAAEAIAVLEPEIRKLDPELRRRLVESYLIAGDAKAANRLAATLYGAGYRHPAFLALFEAHPDLRAAAFAGVLAR